MSANVTGDNINEVFIESLRYLFGHGETLNIRGSEVCEVTNFTYELTNVNNNVITIPYRYNNFPAVCFETLWVLSGCNNLKYLKYFLPNCVDYSDNRGLTWGGCFTLDTKIPLLNGEIRSLKWLINKKKNESFWVWSFDTEMMKYVPGLAHSPRITKYVDELTEITLDNNESFRCTADHEWMMIDGSYLKAESLNVGCSLNPLDLYTTENEFKIRPYSSNKSELVYRYIGELFHGNNYGYHHLDKNHYNNNPDNIIPFSNQREHMEYHKEDFSKMVSNNNLNNWKDNDYRNKMSSQSTKILSSRNKENWKKNDYKKYMSEVLRQNAINQWKNDKFVRMMKEVQSKNMKLLNKNNDIKIKQQKSQIINTFILMKTNGLDPFKWKSSSLELKKLGKIAVIRSVDNIKKYFGSFENLVNEINMVNNHKIKSIRKIKLKNKIPVGDITVEKYNNFGLWNGCIVHNSYGPRIRYGNNQNFRWQNIEEPNPHILNDDQIFHVLKTLIGDKFSRQAIIMIGDSTDYSTNTETKDRPCNFALQFYIRNDKLNCTVFQRSGDVIWGTFNINIFEWTTLQRMIANCLGIDTGSLTHHITSFHYYTKQHGKMIDKIFANSNMIPDIYNESFDVSYNAERLNLNLEPFDVYKQLEYHYANASFGYSVLSKMIEDIRSHSFLNNTLDELFVKHPNYNIISKLYDTAKLFIFLKEKKYDDILEYFETSDADIYYIAALEYVIRYCFKNYKDDIINVESIINYPKVIQFPFDIDKYIHWGM